MRNYKEIMNLNSKCSYLVCSTCYNENGPKCSGAGHVTCPKCDDLHIIRCEMVKRVYIQKGTPYAIYSLAILIIVIIAKNAMNKTSSNYDELYTIRIGFACRFRICSQNINLSPHEVL